MGCLLNVKQFKNAGHFTYHVDEKSVGFIFKLFQSKKAHVSPNAVFSGVVFVWETFTVNLCFFKHFFYKPIINTCLFLVHEKTPHLFSHP